MSKSEAEVELADKVEEIVQLVERSQVRLREAIQKFSSLLLAVSDGSMIVSDRCCDFLDAGTKSIYEASNTLLDVALALIVKHSRGQDVRSEMADLEEKIRKAIADVEALHRIIDAGGPS